MVTAWLKGASRHPLLTAAQEIELGSQVRAWKDAEDPDKRTIQKGRRAREKMIKSNMKLCSAVVKKFLPRIKSNPALSHEDLLQEASVGLARAVEKFDPAAGYKFSTYAYWWIRQSVGRMCDVNSSSIKVTPPVQHLALKWRYRPDGQTLEQFADERNESTEKVKERLQLWNRAQVKSLDAKAQMSDDDSESLLELIAADELPVDDQDYAGILDDLKHLDGGILRESLAVLELAEEYKPAEIADLMGWGKHEVGMRLKDCRSTVREHLPSHVREAIVGPEKNPSVIMEVQPVATPKPVKELVAVGCSAIQVSPMQSTNGHHETTLEQEAATVIAEVQAEPRRRRRTKAEVVAEKAVKLQVNGLGLEGTAADVAAVLKAYDAA